MAPAHSILAAASSSSSSSSNHGSCNAEPSGPMRRAIEAKIDELVNGFAEMHPGIDRAALTWLCHTYYFDSDKMGFVYDFDMVWPLLGYSNKASPKRAVSRILEKGGTFGTLSRENDMHLAQHRGGASSTTRQHGGQNREKIMLTWSGFSSFCQLSRTPQGDLVRAFTSVMVFAFRQFERAVDAGEVEIRRVNKASAGSRQPLQISDANRTRIENCEQAKTVGAQLCEPGKRFDARFGVVHGAINIAATGLTKDEMMRRLGKKNKNFSARDYMTAGQQHLAAALLAGAASCQTPEEVVSTTVANARELQQSKLARRLHYGPDKVPMGTTLKRARKSLELAKSSLSQ